VSDYDGLETILRNQDFLVNFVAQTHVDRSIHDSRPFIISEVLGTDNLLRAARKMNVSRYLQVSTDEVYGEIRHGKFKPTDPLNPRNPYSAAKAGADMLVRANWYTFGLPVVITRCSNNFGPYQHVEKFIPKIITHALDSKPIPIYGDGKQVRDWIHVKDYCAAIALVLEKGVIGQIYHVATGTELQNVQVAKHILSILGKDEKLLKYVDDRLGHDKRYSLDTTATRELGWTPSVSFEKGLDSTVKWYIENSEWWRTLAAEGN
jgi:dTDP-glucose 4,6-dehydratase